MFSYRKVKRLLKMTEPIHSPRKEQKKRIAKRTLAHNFIIGSVG
jgi:hypothetical protein